MAKKIYLENDSIWLGVREREERFKVDGIKTVFCVCWLPGLTALLGQTELGGMSEMGMNEDSVIWVTVQMQTIAGKW